MAAKPFRVLMLSRYFPPEYSGTAFQAIALAKELRKRGHEIEFIAQRWPGLSAQAQVEGFPVWRLEAGHGNKHREFRFWWNLFVFLSARRNDFDLLHSHSAYYTDAIVGPLASWFGMKSLVKASLAENDLYSVGNRLNTKLHRVMLRKIGACVAISHDLEAEFVQAGIQKEKIYFLPNGVDIERFSPVSDEEKLALRSQLGLPLDQRIALYVGVFDARKNIAWLMRRWQETRGFGSNALLLAVGPQAREDLEGTFRQSLVDLAEDCPELLCVAGPTDSVADYYSSADLFVLPSHQEGLPNALLEAMACGLPAVAAKTSGSLDLIRPGETGYLYDIDDTSSCQAAVSQALGPASAELGRAARKVAEQEYSIGQLASRYEHLYAHLLNNGV